MPVGEAALLGLIQGLTEFLPVSSDGHLALAQLLLGLEPSLAITVFLRLGTLAATLVVLRKPIRELLGAAAQSLRAPRQLTASPRGHDLVALALATIPTGVIGLTLKHSVEAWTKAPLAIGIGFVITSLVLASTIAAPDGKKDAPSYGGAVLVGIAQGLAVAPGVSRSASTIAMLLWLGVRRDRAFDFSMLLSLPAVAGAVTLEAKEALQASHGTASLAVGTTISFGVGVVALLLLRRIVVGGRFAWFALWVAPLSMATLALAWAWPGG